MNLLFYLQGDGKIDKSVLGTSRKEGKQRGDSLPLLFACPSVAVNSVLAHGDSLNLIYCQLIEAFNS